MVEKDRATNIDTQVPLSTISQQQGIKQPLEQQQGADIGTEQDWYALSHSDKRIDKRMGKDRFDGVRQQLFNLLPGGYYQQKQFEQQQQQQYAVPPPPPPMPSKGFGGLGMMGLGGAGLGTAGVGAAGVGRGGLSNLSSEGSILTFDTGTREWANLPKSMRALVTQDFNRFSAFENCLLVNQFPIPSRSELGQDEVLVRIRYTGLNAMDWRMNSGMLRDSFGLRPPFINGREGSGVIVRIGSNVQRNYNLNIGDEVVGVNTSNQWGTFGEYAVFHGSTLCLKPTTIGYDYAASLPVAAITAWDCFDKIGIKNLEHVRRLLILDNGRSFGTTPLLLLLAKYHYLIDRVIVSCPASMFDYYKQLGADKLIDMEKEQFDEILLRLHEDEIRVSRGETPMMGTAQVQQPAPGTTVLQRDPGYTTTVPPDYSSAKAFKREGAVDAVIDLVGNMDYQNRSYRLLSKKNFFLAVNPPPELEEQTTTSRSDVMGFGRHVLKNKLKGVFGGPRYYAIVPTDFGGRKLRMVLDFLLDKGLLNRMQLEKIGLDRVPEYELMLRSGNFFKKCVAEVSHGDISIPRINTQQQSATFAQQPMQQQQLPQTGGTFQQQGGSFTQQQQQPMSGSFTQQQQQLPQTQY